MKFFQATLFVIGLSFVIISCNQDDSCSTNADLNGDCFNLDVTINTQEIRTSPSYIRENALFIFQFPPMGPQERVRLTLRSDDNPQANTQNDTVFFEIGKTYSDLGNCIFNGDLSSGGISCRHEYRFTKIDRQSNLASGTINFSYSNDFGSDEFSGSFEDVELKKAQ